MFTKVLLSDFKSFSGEHTIDLRRISVFIGPNGSGKSSVLQALLLWRQSAQKASLESHGDHIDLGEPDDLTSGQGNVARVGLMTEEEMALPTLAGNHEPVQVKVDAVAEIPERRPRGRFRVSSPPLTLTLDRTQGGSGIQPDSHVAGDSLVKFGANNTIARQIKVVSHNSASLADEVERLLSVLSQSLLNIRLVPALRGFSAARYSLGPQDVDDFGLPNVDMNARQLATTLAYDNQLREEVGNVLHSITGVKIDRELAPERQTTPVTLRTTSTGTKRVVPTNEGFGTNQLVHLLSQTLVTPDGGTVIIEEPEIHLHPSAESKLGMWVAEHAIDRNKQFLIATHSERFLAALLWQVRERSLEPSDLIIHYFDLDDNEQSRHKRLDVTHGGIIQGSFRDFFPSPKNMPNWDEFFRGLYN